MGELLREGAPIEWRNSSKYTPLMWAAGHRHEAVVGKLVEWSAYRNLAGRGHHAGYGDVQARTRFGKLLTVLCLILNLVLLGMLTGKYIRTNFNI